MQENSNELRLSLLPGLIDAAKRNASRTLVDLALFEIGLVFLPAKSNVAVELPTGNVLPSEAELQRLRDSIPVQPLTLAALFMGDRVGQQVGRKSIKSSYADAISLVRNIANVLSVELVIEQAEPQGFHPGRSAVIKTVDGVTLGFAGELNPELTAQNDLPRQVSVLEINLDALFDSVPETVSANAIYTFPAATQDLSLVMDQSVSAAEIQNVIRSASGELLEDVVLVDDYRGGNLEANQKSLTFALRFRAEDRTLTQVEASEARDRAVSEANRLFGATLRA
jgi:phenylalanyl-tRNA synthetase beta chain